MGNESSSREAQLSTVRLTDARSQKHTHGDPVPQVYHLIPGSAPEKKAPDCGALRGRGACA